MAKKIINNDTTQKKETKPKNDLNPLILYPKGKEETSVKHQAPVPENEKDNPMKQKKAKKVITLEITDEQDYLDLMAKHEGVPRTKYIRNLIKADQEKNLQKYEALKLLRDLEK